MLDFAPVVEWMLDSISILRVINIVWVAATGTFCRLISPEGRRVDDSPSELCRQGPTQYDAPASRPVTGPTILAVLLASLWKVVALRPPQAA
jgi:hypothetical protein